MNTYDVMGVMRAIIRVTKLNSELPDILRDIAKYRTGEGLDLGLPID